MYVKETRWYQKQQRTKLCGKYAKNVIFLIALAMFVYLSVVQVIAKESEKREAEKQNRLSELNEVDLQKESKIICDDKRIEQGEISETKELEDADEVLMEQEASSDISTIQNADIKYRIAIDAGHGGEDEGCSYETINEKDINLQLAIAVKEKLEQMGFEVFMVREADVELSPKSRVNAGIEESVDAYISIHQNSCQSISVNGIETWYCADSNEKNERLAKLVQQYTVLYSKGKDRGIRENKEIYVLRENRVPSCLIETGFLSNTKEREQLGEYGYLNKVAQGIADGVELFFYPKTMYLTFDDGPTEENTNKVLDILKARNIKATFFVVGKNAEIYPEVIKRIVKEGHTLGIHCYSHEYEEIYSDVNAFIEDFERAKEVIYEITGNEVNIFRFPGGSINSYNEDIYMDIIEEMTERGYIYYDWNASLDDAVKNPSIQQLIHNAKSSTLGRKQVIMLAHDIVDETVACLEELLDTFPEYEMKPLGKNVETIQF